MFSRRGLEPQSPAFETEVTISTLQANLQSERGEIEQLNLIPSTRKFELRCFSPPPPPPGKLQNLTKAGEQTFHPGGEGEGGRRGLP